MKNDDLCMVSVATFNRLADRYTDKYFHLDIYDSYLSLFVERIEAHDATVLDVACGPGNVAHYLTRERSDLKVVGIDLAEEMVRQARIRVPTAEFLVKDCRRIDELNQEFDAPAFAFGLSYLTEKDTKQFFISLNACLSDNAILYLSTITGEPGKSGFETSSSEDSVYMVYRSVSDVLAMVEQAGYRVDFQKVTESPENAPKPTQDLILIAQRKL